MRRTRSFLLAGVLCITACGQHGEKPRLDVMYIANEGFMIAMGTTTVLIDALPKSDYYANPSDSMAARMIDGIQPFDGVDYVLVTHDHPDHFNAEMMSRFLLRHPGTQLIASSETCSKLQGDSSAASRLQGIGLAMGEQRTIRGGGGEIVALRLKHGGYADVSNLAYVVRSNGYTFVHVGDARLSENDEHLRTLDWTSYDVDLLFLEYFDHSDETRKIIETMIRPKLVVLMHIPPGEEEAVRNAGERVHPRTVVFEREGETKRLAG